MLPIVFASIALASEPAPNAPNAAEIAEVPAPVATASAPERHVFSPTALRLDVHVERGPVSVRTDATIEAPEIRIQPTEGACETSRESTHGPRLDVRGCTAAVEIVAPRHLAVHLSVGDGDVTLATASPVRVRVGTGDVLGTARGRVHVHVDEGSVALEGLTTRPRVKVARGSTDLSFVAGR